MASRRRQHSTNCCRVPGVGAHGGLTHVPSFSTFRDGARYRSRKAAAVASSADLNRLPVPHRLKRGIRSFNNQVVILRQLGLCWGMGGAVVRSPSASV
jgi:hypothetical protein